MSTRQEIARQTSRSLHPFTKGQPLPYRSRLGILVTSADPHPDATWGIPVRRDNKHLIGDLAIAWEPSGAVIGARWLCGGSSIGINVWTPGAYMERYGAYYSREAENGEFDPDRLVCQACRAKRDGEDGPCVYRVFDKSRKRLLYIGSTKNWPSRQTQHRGNTWWWSLAKHVDLEFFSTIQEARVAEAAAIRAERPQMNVMHNRGASA